MIFGIFQQKVKLLLNIQCCNLNHYWIESPNGINNLILADTFHVKKTYGYLNMDMPAWSKYGTMIAIEFQYRIDNYDKHIEELLSQIILEQTM